MTGWIPIALWASLWFLNISDSFMSAALAASATPPASTTAQVPNEYTKGEAAFNRYCAACHGKVAAGTDHGPTFIHRIYEPNHHGDQSFLLAPRMGVRAHHWNYGDMPKIEGVSDEDLKQIVGYIRWLQRQAGIN
ncbi:MAG: cytochrome c [Nitrospirae bacterium]|nr:cytochrome c [Nitrospirota bacterium]